MELTHTYIYNEDPASIAEEVLGLYSGGYWLLLVVPLF